MSDGISAMGLSEDLGVQYKTAFFWLHKFRDEATNFMNAICLEGEVEVDGDHFGGTIRPKNVKKKSTDRRRIPERHPDGKMAVTFAVERGGAIRTWVAKQEGHPRKLIEQALAEDAAVYTDMASCWNAFAGKRKLFQVNHSQAYMTPEACTNAAESAIGSLRAAEDVHRHIAQNYLDLYAGEAGWRVTHNRNRKAERFETLMTTMARPGRSSLTGYFAGKKRSCLIVDENGERATWRPPTRAERDRRRAEKGYQVNVGPYRSRRTADNWHHDFEFVGAADLMENWSLVRERPGVYLICVRAGAFPLADLGVGADAARPWMKDDCNHLYTGETYGLRSRLKEHLTGATGRSNLRETLLALEWSSRLRLDDDGFVDDRARAETRLTKWLQENVLVGFKQSAHIQDYERDILRYTASPLNIRRESGTDLSRSLLTLRKEFREDVLARWEPIATAPTRRFRH